MKKLGYFLFFVLCIGFVFIDMAPTFQEKVEIQTYDQYEKIKLADIGIPKNIKRKEIPKEQVFQGNLLLVNREFPVHPESEKSDIVNLFANKELTEGYGLLDGKIELSKDVALAFSKMIKAAEKEGVHHFLINSGYRGFDKQRELYLEMGPDFALPAGYSEHNLGLSLDVGSSQMKMSEAAEGKWIERNAWKYGFVLRYPKDKIDVTGIQYEPWHIRYVGLPHSAIMHKKNFVLEEYLDFLKKEKAASANVNGVEYTISYYLVSESMTIKVPQNNHYEISGNNIDGVIVTGY
ncbi:VanY-A/VanY-F/VanY-M family D-Ala-D-Ala carboxypeptidase [Peribacillus muralis]|uniref:VanY-A/VanY-F/VanY-M family D-Ala-D-Ala carboxypeptidase n=1 Tax=Peribacillus muralis TaxID=264697 RepID=UPI001F4E26EF|nr:VanY-A/VanY-F/VanY-M family D-Ala-D-Ala carboxypeptidase [Peribacillus muralis]MCK1992386.1 VanY-A/VanY-F/VanY-M family D-Ala-D-Ala carboxypeptidase [Peribacillus muralis]MCK2012942.1 VanY-A/VanY-F/VanY-M family D-Ala-D-Ala carboxypeptidase [Peribacillus muralis]